MKKYYVDFTYGRAPVPVEVKAETAWYATIVEKDWSGNLCLRRTRKTKIFNTFEEAKQALYDMQNIRLRNAESEVQRVKSELAKIRELREA